MNILFICSRNKWRSRTAEEIFKNRGHDIIKSAGTENSARIKVNKQLLNWVDRIFVMEEVHKKKLLRGFNEIVSQKEVIVLDITDDYKFMDKELIDLLRISTAPYFD